jgi:hypothetical protein
MSHAGRWRQRGEGEHGPADRKGPPPADKARSGSEEERSNYACGGSTVGDLRGADAFQDLLPLAVPRM